MIKRIAALVFIFVCTTIAWLILGGTISSRTYSRDSKLRGMVGAIWGTEQEQSPPKASYKKTETSPVKTLEDGKEVVRTRSTTTTVELPLEGSHINVDLNLHHRQKGLLWYSTYAVDFSGDYKFRNDSVQQQIVTFRFAFPAEKAIYDGLVMQVNGQALPAKTDASGAFVQAPVAAGQTAAFHVAYRSQGLGSWSYKLGNDVAQVHNLLLTMNTNFRDIDFAADTLSPTEKHQTAKGWELVWRYTDLVSGFQIGMTMPDKLQPGPLAGEISYFAPVSLLFFFFLMFIITTLNRIELHPMNYFFLAAAFFSFHLLLAYLVDHISIHAAFVICSLVSIALVISYLRLVAGMKFAALYAGTVQLIYLVLFSYAFFFKGFTGLAITIGAILTLFVVMQMTGRIRWAEKFAAASAAQAAGAK